MEKENVKKLRPEMRKVTKTKGSFQINIPKKFIRYYGIKAGDSVTLVPGLETINVLPMKGCCNDDLLDGVGYEITGEDRCPEGPGE